MQGFEAVIWDWNGTLFDDVVLALDALNTMIARRGWAPVDLTAYRASFGFPVREYYVRLGFDFNAESWTDVAPEFMTAYEARRARGRLRDGARHILRRFREQGRTQVILSAYPQADLEDVVSAFDLSDYFVQLVGLDNHYAESKVELGHNMMRTFASAPENTLYVGDTDHDVEVARALGTPCVLIAGGHQSEDRLAACGVPVLPDLAALADFKG